MDEALKSILRGVLYIAIAYAVLVLVVFFMQRRMLYLADGYRPSPQALQAAGLRFWPAEDDAYLGFISDRPQPSRPGSVIVFHGNAGGAHHRGFYIDALQPLGYRVILAEYPGYSARPGEPSESALVSDASRTVTAAREQFGDPVLLWGESLGAGVAAAVAADGTVPVAGLILMTPWDTLADLAQRHYWYLPARWLLRERYDNIANLRHFDKPVAVLLAEHDEVVPKAHGQRLYDALPGNKKLWVFDNASHNNLPLAATQPWWREVMAFVSKP